MTGLKPYPDYKDSGVEWLRQIPQHWGVQKFRHVFTESREVNGPEPVGPMLSVSGYRGVEVKEYDDENRRRKDEEVETYRVVRPGQLAVNTMWLNYAGLGVSDLTGHMSPAYRAYWIRPDMNPRYVHYLMRSSVYVEGYTALLTGIRPNSLQMSRTDLMAFPVLLPPVREQQAIADYLDRETAEIDAFIADQERLIQLLDERRSATLLSLTVGRTEANITAPLGRFLVKLQRPVPENSEVVTAFRDGTVTGRWNRREDGYTFSVLEQAYQGVAKGDLVFHGLDGFAGATGISNDSGKCSPVYHVCGVTEHADPQYMALLLRSFGMSGFLEAYAWSVRQRSVDFRNWATFSKLPISIPSRTVQERAVAQYYDVSEEIEQAKHLAERAIEFSAEKRSALISATVSGKADTASCGGTILHYAGDLESMKESTL